MYRSEHRHREDRKSQDDDNTAGLNARSLPQEFAKSSEFVNGLWHHVISQ
jgi:hypothetical protein